MQHCSIATTVVLYEPVICEDLDLHVANFVIAHETEIQKPQIDSD